MNRIALHTALAISATLVMGQLAGCATLKKVASGGKITQADLVREGDKAYKDNEREKEQIGRLEKQVDENLKQIEEKRAAGQFSSAEYREKSLGRTLDQLKALDKANARLTSAPAKLADIKQKYSREVYERKATAERCEKFVTDAKDNRMNERWNYAGNRIDDYVKCRRKMKDVGVDEGRIGGIDGNAIAEMDAFAEHLLQESQANRVAAQFRYAVAFERDLEEKMERYAEIDPKSAKPAGYVKKMNEIRMKHRDPEEVAAEKAQGAYEAWKKLAADQFEKEWTNIQEAEAKARPGYDKGLAALEKGDFKAAMPELYKARETLYKAAYPTSLAFDTALTNGNLRRGLSYEIAAAIAKGHFDQGDKARLYPEMDIIKTGRKWMSKDDELIIRWNDILADRQGNLTPKTTDQVRRYASRYAKETRGWRTVKDTAKAASGEAYSLLGVELETVSHRAAASDPAANAGKIVKVEEPVTSVSGRSLSFDFRREYQVPTNCWRTKRIASVNLWTGRVNYEQKCNYKTVKDGYFLVVNGPAGVRVAKGDLVTFYAAVGAKKGNNLHLEDAGFVRVAKKGETSWYSGARIGK